MSAGASTRTDIGPPNPPTRARIAVVAACVAIIAAAAVPLILMGHLPGRHGLDQALFHEPTVRIFAHDWPNFDLAGYLAASTPLYHLSLAAVCRFISDSNVALQGAGLLKSLALAALLAWACCAGGRPWLALASTLAVFSSHYVFCSVAWISPENFGWLWVLIVMLLCLQPRVGRGGPWALLALAAVSMVILVLVRQSHLWAAAMVWTAAWLGWERAGPHTDGDPLTAPDSVAPRLRRTAAAVACTAGAFAIVGAFMIHWGGLTPPLFHGENQAAPSAAPGQSLSFLRSVLAHLHPSTHVFMLAAFGIYGLFFLPSLAPAGLDLWRRHRAASLGVLAAALVLLLLAPTTFDEDRGRFRGVWNIARLTPDLTDHINPAMIAAALAGVAVLGMICWRLPRRDALIILAGVAAFTAAQATSSQLRTRYIAPLVLIILALAVCRRARAGLPPIPGRIGGWTRRLELAGPCALALLGAAESYQRAVHDKPAPAWTEAMLIDALFPNGNGPESIRMRPEEPRVPAHELRATPRGG